MRKLLSFGATILMGLGVLCSCSSDEPDDDMIWDIMPLYLEVDILDSNSSSLLDPESAANIIGSEVSIEIDGNSYDAVWDGDDQSMLSRALPAIFHGIRFKEMIRWNPDKKVNEPSGEWRLVIGEFPRDKSYTKDITIRYDNKESVVTLNNTFSWKDKKPVIVTKIFLDGAAVDGKQIVLRRD
ncbi:MAG: hypothetical protein HFJ94_06070 [Muribaculaceae bacterium]|nr:hypothetical protein [Muribaculaceae bacterium]